MVGEVFDHLFRFHLTVNANGEVIHVGPSLAKLKPDIIGRTLAEAIVSHDARVALDGRPSPEWTGQLVRMVFDGPRFTLRGEFVANRKTGEGLLFAGSLDPEDGDRLSQLSLQASDFSAADLTIEFSMLKWARDAQVRETKMALEKLERSVELGERLRLRANTDSLTNIANRALFIERLDAETARVEDQQRPATVMMIDVNRFKSINDLHGHRVGDELLRALADRLDEIVGRSGLVARIGGDEFAVLVAGPDAEEVTERLVNQIAALNGSLVRTEDAVVTISLTIGVAALRPGVTSGELLRHADIAMYAARRTSDRPVSRFDPEAQHDLNLRRIVADDLVPALRRQEIELYYQPIVDLKTGLDSGFEVLSRWLHPLHGIISPELFVDVAEQRQVVQKLDRYVVANAIQDAHHYLTVDGELPRLSVNVSALSLTESLAPYVAKTLSDLEFPASKLSIEVTETTSIADMDRTSQTLHQLDEMGITISLDDFGTGFSSLTYLHQLPIGSLKVDRSFVNDLLMSRKAYELVRSIIQVSKALGLPVVAEGIEVPEQRAALLALGAEFGQGYHFGRPVPPTEAALRTVGTGRSTDRRSTGRLPTESESGPS